MLKKHRAPCTLLFSVAEKGPSKDTGTPAEQQFVRSIIELHDKYLVRVMVLCFLFLS